MSQDGTAKGLRRRKFYDRTGTAWPVLNRKSEKWPHYRGYIILEHRWYRLACWINVTLKNGVRIPFMRFQVREQGKKYGGDDNRGVAMFAPRRYSARSPHMGGGLTVYGARYYVAVWFQEKQKDNLKYRIVRMILSPVPPEMYGKDFKDVVQRGANQTIAPPEAWVYKRKQLADYVLGEDHHPSHDNDQYEYERMQRSRERKMY